MLVFGQTWLLKGTQLQGFEATRIKPCWEPHDAYVARGRDLVARPGALTRPRALICPEPRAGLFAWAPAATHGGTRMPSGRLRDPLSPRDRQYVRRGRPQPGSPRRGRRCKLHRVPDGAVALPVLRPPGLEADQGELRPASRTSGSWLMASINSLAVRLKAEARLPPRSPAPVMEPEDWLQKAPAPAPSDTGDVDGGQADVDGEERAPWANEGLAAKSGSEVAADGCSQRDSRTVCIGSAHVKTDAGARASGCEQASRGSSCALGGVAWDVTHSLLWESGVPVCVAHYKSLPGCFVPSRWYCLVSGGAGAAEPE